MILVDEGHHNVASTWRRLFDYFSDAKVVSYTATPLRSDGKIASCSLQGPKTPNAARDSGEGKSAELRATMQIKQIAGALR
jgi:Type III restriction enzyme, res subunit